MQYLLYTTKCTRQLEIDVLNKKQAQVPDGAITFMTLRSRPGLTQEDLAAELTKEFKALGSYRKVTKKSISDWETGRHKPRFTPEETLAVCFIMQCSLNELAKASQSAISAVAA